MNIQFVGTCQSVFKSDKGSTYIAFSDVETGGIVKLSSNGDVPGLVEGGTYRVNGSVLGRQSKDGALFLGIIKAQVKPVTVTISE